MGLNLTGLQRYLLDEAVWIVAKHWVAAQREEDEAEREAELAEQGRGRRNGTSQTYTREEAKPARKLAPLPRRNGRKAEAAAPAMLMDGALVISRPLVFGKQ